MKYSGNKTGGQHHKGSKSGGGKSGGGGGGAKINNKEKAISNDNKTVAVKDEDLDDEPNSGFADYLKSGQGMEMLRLFVVANSLVLFVTVAWPSMKESYRIIRDYIYGEEEI